MFGTEYRARCCFRFHHLPIGNCSSTRHAPPLRLTQQQGIAGNVVHYRNSDWRTLLEVKFRTTIPTMQLFRNVWIAQSAEKLQLYKLFLLENNKDASQKCQYTLTFIVLCRL